MLMRRTKTLTMGEVLGDFFAQPWVGAKVAEGRLPELWRECVGEAGAAATQRFELRGRVLNVHVSSSVLRSELFMRREALKNELNRRSKVPLIDRIVIR